MITILGLVLIVGGVISIAKGIRWLAEQAPYPQEAAEASAAEPCRMCDKPRTGPDHDCADPVDKHFATIPQAIDCSTLGDSEVEMLRRNTIEDLTEEERGELDRQFADAVALFHGPVPYVKGPDQ